MSSAPRSRQASIAAEPVSPEVAPTMVTALAALAQHMVEQTADQLQRIILEGQRRAMEQLEQPIVVAQLLSGATAGWSKPA